MKELTKTDKLKIAISGIFFYLGLFSIMVGIFLSFIEQTINPLFIFGTIIFLSSFIFVIGFYTEFYNGDYVWKKF